MQRTVTFGRTTLTGEVIPREELSTRTKYNLLELESAGYAFTDEAVKIPVVQLGRQLGRGQLGPSRTAHTFVIEGVDDQGRDVVYVRRSTMHPAAGQTLLYTEGKDVVKVSRLIGGLFG